MPTKTGDRVKPDRRDARPRARRMRAGARPPVSVPAVADDAIRDLRRARAETRRALQAATVRRTACVLRPALRSPGRAHWSPAPRRWRSAGLGPTPAPQLGLPADVQTVPAQTERRGRLARARPAPGTPGRFAPGVEALQARRGVPCTGAGTTVAARGALPRFEPPRPRLHELGLTPADYARGARRPQGGLTQTGHTPARRALGAGAWASRSPATGSRHWPRRREQRPQAMPASSWKAQGRLCPRDRQLRAQGQKAHQVVVALARELVGFRWAMARQVPVPPKASRWRWVARSCRGVHLLSAEAQPRCGGTRGGVRRPTGMLVPRLRQAPDGGKEGGPQPTDSSVSNRRV
jgi:transposase